MERKREHLWTGILLAGAALVGFLVLLLDARNEARERVDFEEQALARLEAVSEAARRFHEREGRYGTARELAETALIDATWLAPDGSIVSPRYRIDVLLPNGMSPSGFLRMAPAVPEATQDRLATQHYAVVARPWGEERTGHRTFYVDERGEVNVSEGVADVGGGVGVVLPEFHLGQSKLGDVSGLRWRPLAETRRP